MECLHERALEGYELALGSSHPLILGTAYNLGTLCTHLGRNEEADAMYFFALYGKFKALARKVPRYAVPIACWSLFRGKYSIRVPIVAQLKHALSLTCKGNHPLSIFLLAFVLRRRFPDFSQTEGCLGQSNTRPSAHCTCPRFILCLNGHNLC